MLKISYILESFKNWESSIEGLRLQFLLSIDVAQTSFIHLVKTLPKSKIKYIHLVTMNWTFKQIRNTALTDDNRIYKVLQKGKVLKTGCSYIVKPTKLRETYSYCKQVFTKDLESTLNTLKKFLFRPFHL